MLTHRSYIFLALTHRLYPKRHSNLPRGQCVCISAAAVESHMRSLEPQLSRLVAAQRGEKETLVSARQKAEGNKEEKKLLMERIKLLSLRQKRLVSLLQQQKAIKDRVAVERKLLTAEREKDLTSQKVSYGQNQAERKILTSERGRAGTSQKVMASETEETVNSLSERTKDVIIINTPGPAGQNKLSGTKVSTSRRDENRTNVSSIIGLTVTSEAKSAVMNADTAQLKDHCVSMGSFPNALPPNITHGYTNNGSCGQAPTDKYQHQTLVTSVDQTGTSIVRQLQPHSSSNPAATGVRMIQVTGPSIQPANVNQYDSGIQLGTKNGRCNIILMIYMI